MGDPKKWKGNRERIGVEGSLHRSILGLCERAGLVLVDVRDLGHLSRQVLVFRDEGCMTEVTIESFPLPEEPKTKHPSVREAFATIRAYAKSVKRSPSSRRAALAALGEVARLLPPEEAARGAAAPSSRPSPSRTRTVAARCCTCAACLERWRKDEEAARG